MTPPNAIPSTAPTDAVSAVLKDVFGFDVLRPGQDEAIAAVLNGRNVLAVMPTGSGKSLCYQVPALVTGGLTVVVSPLVALMRDQVEALRLNGVAAATINSDFDRTANVATWRRVQAGEIRLLYLSPERLMTEAMLGALARLGVDLFAIDEAHCISQWGPAFRPEYAELAALRVRFPGTPIIGLTATADPPTQADIEAKIFGGDVVSVVTGFDRPNLSLAVTLKKGWKAQTGQFVEARRGHSGIVYCLSRRKTEEVAALLCEQGHTALAFHAGMEAAHKAHTQNRFMTEPGVVIVATVAFGMGIDKPDIRYVLHTDLPASPEAYYQEIGRAGRDGEPAETMLLYGLDDIRMRRAFIEEEDAGEDRRRREHKRLDALIAYCEAPECRRAMLLRYFGEETLPCGNCDLCLNPVALLDGTHEAQMVLSAVHGTGQRWGAVHIINVLRGSKNEKISKARHDELPSFGLGKERATGEWSGIIRQMVAAGLLEIDIAGYGGLRATQAGARLMQDEGEFRYRPDTITVPKSARRTATSAAAQSLDDAGAGLLQRLKALRLDLAKARDVPAYAIFSDKTLIDMAARRPADRDGFAEVYGVGAAKLKDFADVFLREIESARP
ncbi:MAG TPA: DNA helicase RecQ [Alphaproteobacteria bacterium]|nr:DNA helicase RecQ [Alphaproteobacteria bacterium]